MVERLRVLTFNMQLGAATNSYRQMLTGAWRHILPFRAMRSNLQSVAELASAYDLVALQEADGGSLRSGFVNQVQWIAQQAGFEHWSLGLNRDLAPFAKHSLGLLSRYPLLRADYLRLPGRVPGRGAIEARIEIEGQRLSVVVTHLALGRRAQLSQLSLLAQRLEVGPALIMGDFNCEPELLASHPCLRKAGLQPADICPVTYPRWQPTRAIDHVLVGGGLRIEAVAVPALDVSDHCPLAVDIAWPPDDPQIA